MALVLVGVVEMEVKILVLGDCGGCSGVYV